MKKKRQTTDEAAGASLKAYSKVLSASVLDALDEELSRLDWEGVEHGIACQGGVKAMLEQATDSLADIRPIQRLALYADSVIVSRPAHAFEANPEAMRWRPEVRLFLAISEALDALQVKELFLADVTPPIAVLARPLAFTNVETRKVHSRLTTDDTLALCSGIFGAEFSSLEEMENFLRNHKTLDSLCKDIKKPGLFFEGQDHEWFFRGSIKDHMRARYVERPGDFVGSEDPELLVAGAEAAFFSCLGVANSQLFSCGRLGAQPCADNDEQWRYLIWKFKHDSRLLAEKSGHATITEDSLVLNALRLDEFSWLGNVPIEGIVKLRQDGELQSLRDALGRGIERIQSVSDDDFVEVTRQVGYNLDQEFKRHKAQLKSMDENFRRKWNFNLASLTVGGTIALTSTMFPPLATLAAFLGPISVTKTIYDILQERAKRSELRRKPVALLFKAYENGNAQTQPSQSQQPT
jgi:hypothetical protein